MKEEILRISKDPFSVFISPMYSVGKVMSSSLKNMDFAVRPVDSVPNLPEIRQVKFLEKISILRKIKYRLSG